MLGMLAGGENIYSWLFMMGLLITLDKAFLSQRQDAAAGTQTAELFVILMACLFSFA